MIVINLYGGPGTGKSTTAAGLFYNLKSLGHKTELVTEYAKDIVYEGHLNIFEDQLFILANQRRKLVRLENHRLDFVITDCPLLLNWVYGATESVIFHTLVKEYYDKFANINIFLNRVKPFQSYGRIQKEDTAKEIDTRIKEVLADNKVNFHTVDADYDAPAAIVEYLKSKGFINEPIKNTQPVRSDT